MDTLKIGLALNAIAMQLPDNEYRNIKKYLKIIEECVLDGAEEIKDFQRQILGDDDGK